MSSITKEILTHVKEKKRREKEERFNFDSNDFEKLVSEFGDDS